MPFAPSVLPVREDNPLAEPLDPDAEDTKSREELEMDATQEDLGNDDGASQAPTQGDGTEDSSRPDHPLPWSTGGVAGGQGTAQVEQELLQVPELLRAGSVELYLSSSTGSWLLEFPAADHRPEIRAVSSTRGSAGGTASWT